MSLIDFAGHRGKKTCFRQEALALPILFQILLGGSSRSNVAIALIFGSIAYVAIALLYIGIVFQIILYPVATLHDKLIKTQRFSIPDSHHFVYTGRDNYFAIGAEFYTVHAITMPL